MKTLPLAINNHAIATTTIGPRRRQIFRVGVFNLWAVLGLLTLGGNTALAQGQAYCSCSTSSGSVLAPFWQILNGGSAYAKSASGSTCAWYHNANNMAARQGWGVTHPTATLVGDGTSVVYQVDINQPSDSNLSTDIIFDVDSTNCNIGFTNASGASIPGVFGGTAAGGYTNTTAFRAAYNFNGDWTTVCFLTNRVGIITPEIEFHYHSGINGRTYIDCIRFTQISRPCLSLDACSIQKPVPPTGQFNICGSGCVGWNFVLLQSVDPTSPMGAWMPLQTNTDGVGTYCFTVDTSAAQARFFRIQVR